MTKTCTGVLVGAAVLLASASHASAQDRSSTRGLLLGAYVGANSIQLDEEGAGEAERGGGVGVMLGYGLSSPLTLFVRAEGANIAYAGDVEGTFTLGNVDLGGRYNFGTSTEPLRPYVEAGFSGSVVSDELDEVPSGTTEVTFTGGRVFLGGGLEYFFNRKAAADVGMVVGKGRFVSADVNNSPAEDFEDLDFTTVRLSVGLNVRL